MINYWIFSINFHQSLQSWIASISFAWKNVQLIFIETFLYCVDLTNFFIFALIFLINYFLPHILLIEISFFFVNINYQINFIDFNFLNFAQNFWKLKNLKVNIVREERKLSFFVKLDAFLKQKLNCA